VFSGSSASRNSSLIAWLIEEPAGVSLLPAISTGVLALPLVPADEATDFVSILHESIAAGSLTDGSVRNVVPRALGFTRDEAVFPPWVPRRFDATTAGTMLFTLLAIAEDYSVAANDCFATLGALGNRAILALRSENCFDADDYALESAVAARANFAADRDDARDMILKPAAAANPEPEANDNLATSLSELSAAALALVSVAASPGAHRLAMSKCVRILSSCVAAGARVGATPVQLQACFAPVPAITTATIFTRAGLPAPALAAPLQALHAAQPLGHPALPIGGGIDLGVANNQLPPGLPPAVIGGNPAFGTALPPPSAVPAPRAPAPGTPLPSRYIAPGAWFCPADFLDDPTDPESVMRAQSEELVFTSTGGYIPKSSVAKQKPLETVYMLLFGGARLGDWAVATGRWLQAESTEHTQFIHHIVKLVHQGRDWSSVREVEMAYRRGMYTGKYVAWGDTNTLSSLIVLNGPGPAPKARRQPSPPDDADQSKKKVKKGGISFVHDTDSNGKDICRNWNNGMPCFGRGKGKNKTCQMSHRCAVCLQPHKACDHH
jgi:hypothetical protein